MSEMFSSSIHGVHKDLLECVEPPILPKATRRFIAEQLVGGKALRNICAETNMHTHGEVRLNSDHVHRVIQQMKLDGEILCELVDGKADMVVAIDGN